MFSKLLQICSSLALVAALTSSAFAEEPAVDFAFADETTPLPSWVNPNEVLTIATEQKDGLTEGLVLLTDGRVVTFVSVTSRPLAQPRPEVLAQLH